MKLVKILNNNAAVALNAKGQETVVMGKGIAFHCRIGDEIDHSIIDKTFSLNTTSPELMNKFQQIFATIPMETMLIAERVIEYARQKKEILDDCIYITLPDHINTAIERYKKGIRLKNPLTEEIRRLYREEFDVGEEAARIVKEKLSISFLDDEKAFIAMHFVNAQVNESGYEMNDIYKITQIIREILDLVSVHFHLLYDPDSLTYFRFVTHLKFFAQRLLNSADYKEDEGDRDLFTMVCQKYREAFLCAQKIQRFLIYKYHYTIRHEEITYLTMHIARIIRNPA